jgi:DNA-directed RNA polymerase specialized sigma54-like protein
MLVSISSRMKSRPLNIRTKVFNIKTFFSITIKENNKKNENNKNAKIKKIIFHILSI